MQHKYNEKVGSLWQFASAVLCVQHCFRRQKLKLQYEKSWRIPQITSDDVSPLQMPLHAHLCVRSRDTTQPIGRLTVWATGNHSFTAHFECGKMTYTACQSTCTFVCCNKDKVNIWQMACGPALLLMFLSCTACMSQRGTAYNDTTL